MVEHEIGDVAVAPLLEEAGIAVLAFGIDPHVETLGHGHHTHRVAEVHQQGGGHVVGASDGVASHLLQLADALDEGGLVLGGTERTEVMVQADTLQLAGDSIQLESLLLAHAHCAQSHLGLLDVGEHIVLVETGDEGVEIGRLGRPHLGFLHVERGGHLALGIGLDAVGCHKSALVVIERYLHRGGGCGFGSLHPGIHQQGSVLLAQLGRTGKHAPGGDVLVGLVGDEFHRTVDTATGIPSAALFHIVQVHLQQVVALLHIGGDVYTEGVVAVGPVAGFLAVDVDGGLTHGTVEEQFGVTATGGDGEMALIESLANPGQASRLLRFLLLAILFDGYYLQVPFLVEGTADGPVVRDADLLPTGIVA